jgi:L-malate glycosyltransferase
VRIAILANAASPHTRRWATAFTDKGHEVHVVSIRRGDIPWVATHRLGVGPAASRRPWWALLSYVRLLLGARRLLRRIAPDVVHAHYSVTHGTIAVLAGWRPVVVTLWGSDLLRGDRPVGWVGRRINRFVLRRADGVTAASRFMAVIGEELAGDGRTVRHVPFGVDTDAFRPAAAAPGRPFTVGFVKSFEAKYGAGVLVEAFTRVVERVPDARLVLVGAGSRQARLERLIERLGLAGRVDLPGRVLNDRVPTVMAGFDVLANPSRSEAFGVVLLEASASGLPVVATRVGGTAETVVDGVTGLLVPVDDPAALAEALVALADDPERRRRMGEAGRAMVVADYRWDRCVDRMLAVFAEAAGT